MANKSYSLAHTKWMCKYHIVFTPKYRRKIIYNKYREDLVEIMKTLCKYKGVEIIEGHMMPDHVHMLVAIPPRISVSSFMGYLKGKSALMMFERHANLKYKFGNRHFWAEGYYWFPHFYYVKYFCVFRHLMSCQFCKKYRLFCCAYCSRFLQETLFVVVWR